MTSAKPSSRRSTVRSCSTLSAREKALRRRLCDAAPSSPEQLNSESLLSNLTMGKPYTRRPLAKLRRMEEPTTEIPRADQVTEALTNVIDPELGLDFVELGLVYDVEVDGGSVTVTFTLTTPACPIGPQVSEQMQEFVGELDWVEEVTPKMIFTPPWTPDRMSEDAKFALGF